MRGSILFGLALAISLTAAPRGSRACGRGAGLGVGYEAVITMLAVGAVDVGLTLWDGGSAIASRRLSTRYGVWELFLSAPQLALGSYGLITQLNSGDRSGIGFTAFYTVWMGLLSAHGIWTILANSSTATGPSEPDGRLRIGPPPKTAVLALAPTYVALGERSQPGFGLVGRF
jgi:hypothetical protein